MNVLLIYATYSGGTLAAAQHIIHRLQHFSANTKLQLASQTSPNDLIQYDLVIIGSPSWLVDEKEGQPHLEIGALLNKSQHLNLNNKKFAVFGLGEADYAHFCGANQIIENFIREKGGTLICNSLCIDGYFTKENKSLDIINQWVNTIASGMAKVNETATL